MHAALPGPLYVIPVLVAVAAGGPLAAQSIASPRNVASTVTTSFGNTLISSLSLPVGPIANGQVLATGSPVVAGTTNASLSFTRVNVAPATSRYEVLAQASAGSGFDFGCYCPIIHNSNAVSSTRLELSAPQPMTARVRISLTAASAFANQGVNCVVDLGADGTNEFVATATTSPQDFFLPIGPMPLPVGVDVSAASWTYVAFASGLIRIDIQPVMAFTGGHGQVVPSSEPFPQPITVQAFDAAGLPLVGAPVAFSVTGPASLSATNVATDASGNASVNATALGAGGLVTVRATTPGGNPAGTPVLLFSRHLGAVRTPATLDLTVTNAPTAASGPVPMVLAIAPAGITPLQTFLGPICTNPLDPATIVFEDSLGAFGFASLSGQGAIGAPDLVRSYALPAGVLAGVVVWLQGVGFDPDRGLFRTNCEQLTL